MREPPNNTSNIAPTSTSMQATINLRRNDQRCTENQKLGEEKAQTIGRVRWFAPVRRPTGFTP